MMYSELSARGVTRGAAGPSRLRWLVGGLLLVGVLVLLLNIYELHNLHSLQTGGYGAAVEAAGEAGATRPRAVWIFAKNKFTGYLKHVQRVFARCGYREVDGFTASWDVLWTHDYPFATLAEPIHNMRPFQRLNHFPGTGYITNKVSLATSKINFIPKAFKIPDERNLLLKEISANRDKKWVQKSSNHRGIRILDPEDLELNKEGTFVQEYVSKPLLIDGKKFDIGVYVVLTSVHPLRVYMLDDELLVRFCGKPYHPFRADDPERYVVTDDYTPLWKMESLREMYEDHKLSFKDTLRHYLKNNGYNPNKLFEDIRKVIASVYLDKEQNFINSLGSFSNKRTFFEMVRFDFVLDEKLKLYLMEVNMSPNLSSAHFRQNQDLYEHVLYNMMSVTGVCRATGPGLENSPEDVAEMLVSDRSIHASQEQCLKPVCRAASACSKEVCMLCSHCLPREVRNSLKQSYLEHVSRRAMRRVVPPAFTTQGELLLPDWHGGANVTRMNRVMLRWFRDRCLLDHTWCH